MSITWIKQHSCMMGVQWHGNNDIRNKLISPTPTSLRLCRYVGSVKHTVTSFSSALGTWTRGKFHVKEMRVQLTLDGFSGGLPLKYSAVSQSKMTNLPNGNNAYYRIKRDCFQPCSGRKFPLDVSIRLALARVKLITSHMATVPLNGLSTLCRIKSFLSVFHLTGYWRLF